MIDAIGIANERIGKTGEIDETVPIGVIAGEPRDLETEHETDACESHFGGEAGKAGPCDRAGTGKPEILVNDNDSILRPAKFTSLDRKRILPLGRLAIVLDLGGTGLAQIDDRLAREMACSDLGSLIHRASPALLRRAWTRSAERGARVRPSAQPRRFAATTDGLLVLLGSAADPSA